MGPVKRILAALLLMATALGMCGCMTGDLGAERYSAKMRQMSEASIEGHPYGSEQV